MAKSHVLASVLSMPTPAPIKKLTKAVQDEKKLTRSTYCHFMPVDKRMAKLPVHIKS